MKLSVWENILINLRDVIRESDEFKDLNIYFDESELSPNVSLPIISFQVGDKEVEESNSYCTTYERELDIKLHTKTLDKRLLQSELYEYEEQMIRVIQSAQISNKFTGFEVIETGASSIGALMFHARNEGGQFNETFFSNLLSIHFKIRYEI